MNEMNNHKFRGKKSWASLRQRHGGALVEGVVGVWLVTLIIVGGVLLLGDVGLMLFYKEKVSFIADQAAVYAANVPLSQDPTPPTQQFVNDCLSKMSLPQSHSITVTKTLLGNAPGITVTINMGTLGLLGNGTVLPAFMLNETETGAATMSNMQPPGVFYLWTRDLNQSPSTMPDTVVAIPCWGRFTRASGVLQPPDFARTPGIAMFPRSFDEAYSMSFPLGGFNESAPGGIDYAHFDHDCNICPNSGADRNPPADLE